MCPKENNTTQQFVIYPWNIITDPYCYIAKVRNILFNLQKKKKKRALCSYTYYALCDHERFSNSRAYHVRQNFQKFENSDSSVSKRQTRRNR